MKLNRWLGIGGKPVQTNSAIATTGGHALDRNNVLKQTHSRGRTPTNPGDFGTTPCPVPFPANPKGYTIGEARELAAVATQYRHFADGARLAYKSLTSIDESCTAIHELHRESEGNWAKSELRRVKANQKYARKLHEMRSPYRQLSAGLQTAEELAAHELRLVEIELTGVMG